MTGGELSRVGGICPDNCPLIGGVACQVLYQGGRDPNADRYYGFVATAQAGLPRRQFHQTMRVAIQAARYETRTRAATSRQIAEGVHADMAEIAGQLGCTNALGDGSCAHPEVLAQWALYKVEQI